MEKKKCLRFILPFLLFLTISAPVFASYADGDYSATDEGPDGWDGTSNTPNSPNDESPFGGGGKSYDFEHNITVIGSDGKIRSLSYDDVYSSDGKPIYHNADPQAEARVYDFFKARIASDAEDLVSLYATAITLYANALASNNSSEIQKAKQYLESIKNQLDSFCRKHAFTWQANGSCVSITDTNKKTVAFVGDPVVLSSGDFVVDDCDFVLKAGNTSFSLKRHYSTDIYSGDAGKNAKRSHGAFGPLWKSSLDTRLIRGNNTEIYEKMKTLSEEYLSRLKYAESSIMELADEDSSCFSVLGRIRNDIDDYSAQVELYNEYYEQSLNDSQKNRYVEYGLPSSYSASFKLDTIFYVAENDEIILFEKKSSGNYEPSISNLKNKIYLEKSGTGFKITLPLTGEKRYYSDYGLPLKFVDVNGGIVAFEYDSEKFLKSIIINNCRTFFVKWKNGAVESISDGFQTVSYGYSGNFLESITDYQGDTIKFEYDSEGFMTKQIKADGSFISFQYGSISGKRRVTATVDEENNREQFAYNISSRETTYTNKDGISFKWKYDEQNRTTRLENKNGILENWNYDSEGNLTYWSRENKSCIYRYDDNGFFTLKRYENGDEENFFYEDSKLVSYTGKNGVSYDYIYDADSKLSEIDSAGRMLFSFSYENDYLPAVVTDCRGNRLVYRYDSKQNIIEKILYEKGNTTHLYAEKFDYDDLGRIVYYEGRNGISCRYKYEDHKLVAEYSNGSRISKFYSPRKLLIAQQEEDFVTGEERLIEFEYDRTGRCKSISVSGKDSGGKLWPKTVVKNYEWTSDGKLSSEITSNLTADSYDNVMVENDYALDVNKIVEKSYVYDEAGSLSEISRRVFDNSFKQIDVDVKTFEKYFSGLCSFVSEKNGENEKTFKFDGADRLVAASINGTSVKINEYSADGKLSRIKNGAYENLYFSYGDDASYYEVSSKSDFSKNYKAFKMFPDGKTEYVVLRDGSKINYSYDGNGFLSRIKMTNKNIELYNSPDGSNLRKIITDENGKTVYEESWSYSPDRRTVFHNVGGKLVEKLVKNAFGLLISISDAVENSFYFVYDPLGRVTECTDPYGFKTFYSYDCSNNLVKIEYPDKNVRSFSYDVNNNCICEKDGEGIVRKADYDENGRIISLKERTKTELQCFSYDSFNRLVEVKAGDRIILSEKFDDENKIRIRTDAAGNTMKFFFNEEGQPIKIFDSLENQCSFTYDQEGRLQKKIDKNGVASFYSYSKNGTVKTISWDDGDFHQETYDCMGNLVIAENKNQKIIFEYDTAGNIISQYDKATDTLIEYSYNSQNLLSSAKSAERYTEFFYGKKKELKKIIDRRVSNNLLVSVEVEFDYDSCGREIQRRWNSGEKLKTFYDKAGRIVLKAGYSSDGNLIFADGSVFNEHGLKVLGFDGDQKIWKYRYDSKGRLVELSSQYDEALDAHYRTLLEKSKNYALKESFYSSSDVLSAVDAHKISALYELTGEGTFNFSSRNFLKEQFVYDEKSNLIERKTPYGTIKFTYDKNDRLLKWGNDSLMTYDDNGNMISKSDAFKTVKFTYNHYNRISEAEIYDALKDEKYKVTCSYDPLGRRFVKVDSEGKCKKDVFWGKNNILFSSVLIDAGSLKENVYRGDGFIEDKNNFRYIWLEETQKDRFARNLSDTDKKTEKHSDIISGSSETLHYYLYDPDKFFLAECFFGDYSCVKIFMNDSQGTFKLSVQENQNLSFGEYDLFGTPLKQTDIPGVAGKIYDSDIGAYDFGGRDYDPFVGRFISSDPIMDGFNWYTYCDGDPVNYIDMDGFYKKKVYYMQNYEGELLGDSGYIIKKTIKDGVTYLVDVSDYISNQGCAVTAVAEFLSDLLGVDVDPSYINKTKTNFVSGTSVLSWDDVGKNYGLSISTYETTLGFQSFNFQNGLEHQYTSGSAMSALKTALALGAGTRAEAIKDFLDTIYDSDRALGVIAETYYSQDQNHTHFVMVSGKTTSFNGTLYTPVLPSSINDLNVTDANYRLAAGWIMVGGTVYVPVDALKSVRLIEKNR